MLPQTRAFARVCRKYNIGLCTGKTGHTYTYNGSLLASDVTFRYDQNGAPIGFGYSQPVTATPTEYYYLKNLQGDIIGIVDTSGNRVATYSYDAWGNPLSQPTSGVGALNPLRYRGYVYDTESSLYYLQSRYYSPAIGRFISADSRLNTKDGILGYNMFTYCGNNPLSYADPTGHSLVLTCIIAGAVLGALTGGAIGAYVSKKQTGEVSPQAVIGGAVVGGVIGGGLGWGKLAEGLSISSPLVALTN